MKTLILSLFALTLSTAAFAEETEFRCENRMYRDAELSFNNGSVSVKDSYLSGTPEIGKILERLLGLKGELNVNTINLTVSREGSVKCSSALPFLVECQGNAQKAWLSVDGRIHAEGVSGSVNLTIPVEVKGLRLKTHLSNIGGPISIGGDKPISIRLNKVNLEASAQVILGGQAVDLAWETLFYAREPKSIGSASSCQKF